MDQPARPEDSGITLRIKFKSESLDKFIDRYAVDLSPGGIFIRTKEPLSVGTSLNFDFNLQDGSALMGGQGTVVWVREHDPARVGAVPGMGIRFDKMTPDGEITLGKILAEKSRREREPGLHPRTSLRPSAPSVEMAIPAPTRAASAPVDFPTPGPSAPIQIPLKKAGESASVVVPRVPLRAEGEFNPPAERTEIAASPYFGEEERTVLSTRADLVARQSAMMEVPEAEDETHPRLPPWQTAGEDVEQTLGGVQRPNTPPFGLAEIDEPVPGAMPPSRKFTPPMGSQTPGYSPSPAEGPWGSQTPNQGSPVAQSPFRTPTPGSLPALPPRHPTPPPVPGSQSRRLTPLGSSSSSSSSLSSLPPPLGNQPTPPPLPPPARTLTPPSTSIPLSGTAKKRPTDELSITDLVNRGNPRSQPPPRGTGRMVLVVAVVAAVVVVGGLVLLSGKEKITDGAPIAKLSPPPPSRANLAPVVPSSPTEPAKEAVQGSPAEGKVGQVPAPKESAGKAPGAPETPAVEKSPAPKSAFHSTGSRPGAKAGAKPAAGKLARNLLKHMDEAGATEGKPAVPAEAKPTEAAAETKTAAPASTGETPSPEAAAEPSEEIYLLRVRSTPAGAEVLVDGKSEGKTPYERRIFDPSRPYALTIKLDGYESHERMLSASDEWTKKGNTRTLLVSAKLTKAKGEGKSPAVAAPDSTEKPAAEPIAKPAVKDESEAK